MDTYRVQKEEEEDVRVNVSKFGERERELFYSILIVTNHFVDVNINHEHNVLTMAFYLIQIGYF